MRSTFAQRRLARADLKISRTLRDGSTHKARKLLGVACGAISTPTTKREAEASLAHVVVRYLDAREPADHEPTAKLTTTMDRLSNSAARAVDEQYRDAVHRAVDGMRVRWASAASNRRKAS